MLQSVRYCNFVILSSLLSQLLFYDKDIGIRIKRLIYSRINYIGIVIVTTHPLQVNTPQLMTDHEMIERFNRGMKHTRLESNSLFVSYAVDGVMNAAGYRFLWLVPIGHHKYSTAPGKKDTRRSSF